MGREDHREDLRRRGSRASEEEAWGKEGGRGRFRGEMEEEAEGGGRDERRRILAEVRASGETNPPLLAPASVGEGRAAGCENAFGTPAARRCFSLSLSAAEGFDEGPAEEERDEGRVVSEGEAFEGEKSGEMVLLFVFTKEEDGGEGQREIRRVRRVWEMSGKQKGSTGTCEQEQRCEDIPSTSSSSLSVSFAHPCATSSPHALSFPSAPPPPPPPFWFLPATTNSTPAVHRHAAAHVCGG